MMKQKVTMKDVVRFASIANKSMNISDLKRYITATDNYLKSRKATNIALLNSMKLKPIIAKK